MNAKSASSLKIIARPLWLRTVDYFSIVLTTIVVVALSAVTHTNDQREDGMFVKYMVFCIYVACIVEFVASSVWILHILTGFPFVLSSSTGSSSATGDNDDDNNNEKESTAVSVPDLNTNRDAHPPAPLAIDAPLSPLMKISPLKSTVEPSKAGNKGSRVDRNEDLSILPNVSNTSSSSSSSHFAETRRAQQGSMDGDGAAVVVDIGSIRVRFGFAGSSAPHSSLPTAAYSSHNTEIPNSGAGIRVGTEATTNLFSRNGDFSDWRTLRRVFVDIFHTLGVSAHSQPVLLAWDPRHSEHDADRVSEVLFGLNVPGLYLAPSPVLVLYASGRVTGVTLLSGDINSHACAILDGAIISNTLRRSEMAGKSVTLAFEKLTLRADGGLKAKFDRLLSREAKNTPLQLAHNNNDFSSDHTSQNSLYLEALRRLKAEHCCCAEIRQTRGDAIPNGTNNNSSSLFSSEASAADAIKIKLSLSRDESTQAAELLFRQTLRKPMEGAPPPSPAIQTLVMQCIEEVRGASSEDSADKNSIRQQLVTAMWNNIVVAGGNSSLAGFATRLRNELSAAAREDGYFDSLAVHRATNADTGLEEDACFLGGSVLAKLPSFGQNWITKEEYAAEGIDAIKAKCQVTL